MHSYLGQSSRFRWAHRPAGRTRLTHLRVLPASERGAGGLSGVPGASRVVHGRPPPDDQGWATFGDGGASPPLGGGETPTAVSTSPQPAGWQGPDPFAAATGTPLAPLVMGTSGPGGGHRRASSEPTPVESWRL